MHRLSVWVQWLILATGAEIYVWNATLCGPMALSPRLEPLRFTRIFVEKVWGGRALARAPGIELPAGRPVGETWELADREDRNSQVAEGRFAGRTLGELMRTDARSILGRARSGADGRFPLLVKFLDATQPLSVQVHPHRSTVRAGQASKTEAWYILAAEPGSSIFLGLRPDVGPEKLAAHAHSAAIVDLLLRFDVRAGQFVFVPGGTIHAIGAGVTLVEVQDNSDCTLRFYDWGRAGLDGKPRDIQVEDALGAIHYGQPTAGPIEPRPLRVAGSERASLVDCDEFALDLIELGGGATPCDTNDAALVYVALAGRGRITARDGAEAWNLAPGDTWLVPASFGAHRVEAVGTLKLLRAVTKA
jgi:mannose-6-phosphate isomerase